MFIYIYKAVEKQMPTMLSMIGGRAGSCSNNYINNNPNLFNIFKQSSIGNAASLAWAKLHSLISPSTT